MWSSGFLPTSYDGVALRGRAIRCCTSRTRRGSTADRRTMLDALNQLNEQTYQRFGDPETQTRIAQYEMAFRMQTSVPELTDLCSESQRDAGDVWAQCGNEGNLRVERDPGAAIDRTWRAMVQILHRGWDQHDSLPKLIKNQCTTSISRPPR